MYKVTREMQDPNSMVCPDCGSTRFMLNYRKVVCQNCGWGSKRGSNKFGAKKTVANDGLKRDSKYEASIADELLMRKSAGDILDYDSQYKVIMPIYNEHGRKVHEVSHKVDFRIHNKDGSYELLEAKGVETTDYRFRRKLLENIWLPEHPDHTYTVIKQNTNRRGR